MNQVASYKNTATLETDKKVNLVYGLNGTGKTTLSDFLYNRDKPCFNNCSIDGLNNEDLLVYNQQFIKDYFYESENLNGIFTLSKENKEAEQKVIAAEKEIKRLQSKKETKTEEKSQHEYNLETKKQNAENKVWEIKTRYAGGDRVLEYCLEGLKGQKEKLFNHLIYISKPAEQPKKNTDQLKKEVEAVEGDTAQKYTALPKIEIFLEQSEKNELFSKEIVGNENSSVAELINKLNNSDWVKEGLGYLSEGIGEKAELCPFCQEATVTKSLINNIKDFFDDTYEKGIKELQRIQAEYEKSIESMPSKNSFDANPFVIEKKVEFENLYNTVINCLKTNKGTIEAKLKNPSQTVTLESSEKVIDNLNNFIDNINKQIKEHNEKIDNKDKTLNKIKAEFWELIRWSYDQTVSAYLHEKNILKGKIKSANENIIEIEKKISQQRNIVVEQQKKTVNVDEAVGKINNGLLELGIDGFNIEKHSINQYKLVRHEECEEPFQTLSEGEKMIISFLYFRELCKGKKSANCQTNKKILVIDDPISSLSHIYIFSIGQLIKNEFFRSEKYEQVFVLTHSLYFFYELTDTNHDRRKEKQKLFRMTKNCSGSIISKMKYEEIQNDYHAYWYIIKDDNQPPALIANCMRNIIEYFFNFIEKRDLNSVFQKPELQDIKYQAFCRYIGRESHSLGQNIFDLKEFDYDTFKDGLKLVFEKSGYQEHYEEMTK